MAADIKEYLEAIKKAIYGEEVRSAIHDAIEAINNDSTFSSEELPLGANLDDYKQNGLYKIPSDGTAATISNLPRPDKKHSGTLLVLRAGTSADRVTQVFFTASNETDLNLIYYRTLGEYTGWQKWQGLEGAAASNTIPKAPGYDGSTGAEQAFARGDHVHPFSDREFLPRGAVMSDTDWNTISVAGMYSVENAIGDHNPNIGMAYGSLLVFNRYEYEDKYTIVQIFVAADNIICVRIAKTVSISALSFSPWKRLASTSDIAPTQLALASLYESRTASAAPADMPIESPSIDGELSSLDQNMIKVYADLCLNPDSGKSVDDVPENLRAYVSAIVEKTLAERKDTEERYKAEMEKREADEKAKAEAEAEDEPLTE